MNPAPVTSGAHQACLRDRRLAGPASRCCHRRAGRSRCRMKVSLPARAGLRSSVLNRSTDWFRSAARNPATRWMENRFQSSQTKNRLQIRSMAFHCRLPANRFRVQASRHRYCPQHQAGTPGSARFQVAQDDLSHRNQSATEARSSQEQLRMAHRPCHLSCCRTSSDPADSGLLSECPAVCHRMRFPAGHQHFQCRKASQKDRKFRCWSRIRMSLSPATCPLVRACHSRPACYSHQAFLPAVSCCRAGWQNRLAGCCRVEIRPPASDLYQPVSVPPSSEPASRCPPAEASRRHSVCPRRRLLRLSRPAALSSLSSMDLCFRHRTVNRSSAAPTGTARAVPSGQNRHRRRLLIAEVHRSSFRRSRNRNHQRTRDDPVSAPLTRSGLRVVSRREFVPIPSPAETHPAAAFRGNLFPPDCPDRPFYPHWIRTHPIFCPKSFLRNRSRWIRLPSDPRNQACRGESARADQSPAGLPEASLQRPDRPCVLQVKPVPPVRRCHRKPAPAAVAVRAAFHPTAAEPLSDRRAAEW